MVLLISVDLLQNLANVNERTFLSAIGLCVHTAKTEHKCSKGRQRRMGVKAKLMCHTV